MILVDGQNTLNSEAMQSAFDFYDTLVKEGCFHPDTVSIKAPEARALFAQNQGGVYHSGRMVYLHMAARITRIWIFGVMALPAPDDGMKGQASLYRSAAMDGNFRKLQASGCGGQVFNRALF